MPEITVITDTATIVREFSGVQTVGDILLLTKARFQMPCAGNHTCGKCKVICTGMLSPLTEEEAAFLTEQERQEGYRLACFAKAEGDITVRLPEDVISTLSAVALPSHGCSHQGWGLAVDIGTTTVAAQLYQLESGALHGEALGRNMQARFGADVISRIEFSNKNGVQPLQETICNQLQDMAASCMKQAGISALDAMVITGNTTMLHFLEGLDARGIAVAPFTPVSLFGCKGEHSLLGVHPYLPPALGSYVGADITCAILAAEMTGHPDQTSILIDLGTNGELALFHAGKLYCASTAVGPAFEGAGLAFGMQASPGAVSSVTRNADNSISLGVIPGRPAAGICGSGILDAISVLLKAEILDETGLLCDENPEVTTWRDETAWKLPGAEVYVTQKDIRQIQLAKAAVAAGIYTLLNAVSLQQEQIDRVYIAGGFGHHVNMENAACVGLLPGALAAKATFLGNAVLSGAIAMLLDERAVAAAQTIQSCAQEIALSGNPVFSEYYMENMMFDADG